MKAVSILLQIALFFVATFIFIVLIDYGPRDFPQNAAVEWAELVDTVRGGNG